MKTTTFTEVLTSGSKNNQKILEYGICCAKCGKFLIKDTYIETMPGEPKVDQTTPVLPCPTCFGKKDQEILVLFNKLTKLENEIVSLKSELSVVKPLLME